MSVLITGAGMIGTAAAKQLIAMGEQPVLFDLSPAISSIRDIIDISKVKVVTGDVSNFAEVMAAIVEHGVSGVIHTAALLTPGTRARPQAAVDINLVGTLNVLEASRLANAKRVVLCSSSMLYMGDRQAAERREPYTEDFTMRLISDRTPSFYGITKLCGEYMGLYYNEMYNMHFVAVRFPCVYGPWRGGNTGGLGKDIRELVEGAALHNKATVKYPPDRWQGPDEFIYSLDAGQALVLAYFAEGVTQRVFNATMGTRYTYPELVACAQRVFPNADITLHEVEFDWRGLPPYGRKQPFDISAARRELRFEPEYDLETSFRHYGDWVRSTLGGATQ